MVQPNMVFVTSLCFYVLSIAKCLHNFRIFLKRVVRDVGEAVCYDGP